MFQNETRTHFLVFTALFSVTAGLPLQVLGAKPAFTSYNLKSKYEEVHFFDFSGDGLSQ
jgi:hypothetical protein